MAEITISDEIVSKALDAFHTVQSVSHSNYEGVKAALYAVAGELTASVVTQAMLRTFPQGEIPWGTRDVDHPPGEQT